MPQSAKSICLCMIVKDEAAILERCLASVADHIACWVICDTGSRDGTPDLVRAFFAARDIPGELHAFAFQTFEQARNRGLEHARASKLAFDYMLLVDADMELEVSDAAALHALDAPAYNLLQRNVISYWNLRLLRRDVPAGYRGVTHEYLDLRGARAENLAAASFIDHASGSNRVDKFERDARLLRSALETESDSGLRARYTFYLANTLRDAGDAAGALAAYAERATLGHWDQEVYVSLLAIARLKEASGLPEGEILAAYSEAARACPSRAEALHGAARWCRNHDLHRRGYEYAREGSAILKPDEALFSEDWIYDFGLLDEFAVNAYWIGEFAESVAACRTLLGKPGVPPEERARLERNLKFGLERLRERTASETAAPSTHWTPDRPLAGTELMVEGLRERLGDRLAAIDLRINLYDPATRDGRPLVVWFHHDIDQAAVQWCRDPALVAPVARFVFISHWQRERFVAQFGLVAERCVVIRYAMDRTPDVRLWTPAPVLRCAYTSTPFRGLDLLLDAWERLAPGNAELHVWSSMKLYVADDAPYRHLFERAAAMPGVTYHGLAPNHELRAALRTMHFLAYPNTFAETACLSVMEAMAAGCRVVVPALGALPETTGGYARTYPWCPDRERHVETFARVLADELATPWRGRPDVALAQQTHCATVFSWSRCLDEWRALVEELAPSPSQPATLAAGQPKHAAPIGGLATCLQGLGARGFAPAAILDVGAHDGAFARLARAIHPQAHILMIDALAEKDAVLREVAASLGDASHVIALLGDRCAPTPFFVVDLERRPDLVTTGSSMLRENADFPMVERTLEQRTLATLLDDRPYALVKLDVQGAELAVLRGLGARLADVEVLVIELSLVAYNDGAPLLDEVTRVLGTMGFVLYDLVDDNRMRDGRLLQLDGIFVRAESPYRPRPPFWG